MKNPRNAIDIKLMNNRTSLFVLTLIGLLLQVPQCLAQSIYTPYTFTTLAGLPGSAGTNDTSYAGRFYVPESLAVDSAGNVYVADTLNHTIRKLSPSGVVTTLAGLAGSFGSTDGTGSAARFNYPAGVAVDAAGNVYVADTSNHTIRQVTPAGVVTTLAGAAGIHGSWDGTGNAARFYSPWGIGVDSTGNVYVADNGNSIIRKITPVGVVTTLAGTAGNYGSWDGTGNAARFGKAYTGGPTGVAVDSAGNVYVADTHNQTIRKVTTGGVVTTLAGQAGTSGSADGVGAAARFFNPDGVAVDSAGIVYVADTANESIRMITPSGAVTTLVGLPGANGTSDGTGSAARFYDPRGVAVDSAGKVYVADTLNHSIRKVTPSAVVTTLAGQPGISGSADGSYQPARFCSPCGVAADSAGNVCVADTLNHTIRRVTPAGVVTTLAGLGGSSGSADGTGSAARFNCPAAVAVDSAGNTYVADTWNRTIRKVTPAGVVTTVAGLAGSWGWVDGAGSNARFFVPEQITLDSAGSLYVVDFDDLTGPPFYATIRKITPSGVVTTLPGGWAYGDYGGLAVDSAANVYLANYSQPWVGKLTPTGAFSRVAGSGSTGSADGTGSVATFRTPRGLALDNGGNLYLADDSNYLVRKITPETVVTTIAGLAGAPGSADGTGSAARFGHLWSLAIDNAGSIYVADPDNNTIRKGTPGPPVILTEPAGQTVPIGASVTFTVSASGNGTLSYQWQKDGIAIPGAATTNYTIRSAHLSDSGNYSVVVDSSFGSVTSATAILSVFPVLPSISVQPQSQTVFAGSNVTLRVSASGTDPLSYQWQKDGANVPGAAAAVYAISNAQTNHAGSYRVQVSNAYGSTNSASVTLTVIAAPVITTNPANMAATTLGPLVFCVSAIGPSPLSYQWQRNGVPISRATESVLQLFIASAADLGTIRVQVSNAYGATLSGPATLSIASPGLRLAKPDYWPGIPTTITIAARPHPSAMFYAVEQRLPQLTTSALVPVFYGGDGLPIAYQSGTESATWQVSGISDQGKYDPVSNSVKWWGFFDNLPRDLIFTITPPIGNGGRISLADATISEDGINWSIHGRNLDMSNQHPADNNVARDWRLTADEVTAYGYAWQHSLFWAVPPNPPPIEYLTRAGYLWRNGGYYTNTLIGGPPLWWTNCPPSVTPSPGLDGLPAVSPYPASVTRSAPNSSTPGTAFSVGLTVLPNSNTIDYAVAEYIPAGCIVTNITSGGVIDTVNQEIKWGPFFSSQINRLAYDLVPGTNSESLILFRGAGSFDGSTVALTGRQYVSKLGSTPALYRLFSPVFVPERGLSFGIDGPLGLIVVLEGSTNLRTWTSVSTQTVSSSFMQMSVPLSTNMPSRFYRIEVP